MSLDLADACDVVDMFRLETLATAFVGECRVAEANMVRARRADISRVYGKSESWKNSLQCRWHFGTSGQTGIYVVL